MRQTLLIGGGPAGTGFLLAAKRAGLLPPMIREGLTIVERSAALGAGRLGDYAIHSDSTAATFLTALHDTMADCAATPEARGIAAHAPHAAVPLTQAAAFLDMLGTYLHRAAGAEGADIRTQTEALFIKRTGAQSWMARLRDLQTGVVTDMQARNIVIATGGTQARARAKAACIAARTLGGVCGDKLMLSDAVLGHGGLAAVQRRLRRRASPRIAIIGGSTSALAVANLLLNSGFGATLAPGAVTILHRRALRPFYPSAQAARDDGFHDFGPDDICPLSGFVYRLGGFRLHARDLVLRALRIGGREPDPRLRLHLLQGDDDGEAASIIDCADLVIAALGYRPNAIPVLDSSGRALDLAGQGSGNLPFVDRDCRVLDGAMHALPGLFGIGLAAGFVPHGPLGGEKSFRGQANGLWLWQNGIGAMIAEHICADATATAVA
jgi:hypothetical protein